MKDNLTLNMIIEKKTYNLFPFLTSFFPPNISQKVLTVEHCLSILQKVHGLILKKVNTNSALLLIVFEIRHEDELSHKDQVIPWFLY